VTRDDDERRPESPEPSGREPGEPDRGGAGREWDAAGIDAAFADIVARLQAGDLDTTEGGRAGAGPDGAAGTGDGPFRPRGRRARHARDADEPGDIADRDAPAGADPPGEGSRPGSRADGTPDQQLPGRAGPADTEAGGASTGGASTGGASTGGGQSPPDDLTAEARRRARIEREVDSAVDGPGGGHFVPPDPAPLPRPDAITLLAWIAVIGGPLFLVLGVILGGLPTWVAGVVVAAVVVGFVLLVSRLPRRDETDPDDDGAVV
jgi:hypothetical protein